MDDLGDSNGFDNGFEKVPSAAELEASTVFVQDLSTSSVPVGKAGCSWVKEIDPRVMDLIYWHDVRKSGVVLGSLLVLMLSLTMFSFLSVFSHLSLITLTVTVSYRIYKYIMTAVQKTGESHPFQKFLDLDIAMHTDVVYKFASVVTSQLLSTIAKLRRLFLVEDMIDSLKFGLLLWILTYIGAWFNGMTLIVLAICVLFSLPKIYEVYKVEISHCVGITMKHVETLGSQVKEKLPVVFKKKQG